MSGVLELKANMASDEVRVKEEEEEKEEDIEGKTVNSDETADDVSSKDVSTEPNADEVTESNKPSKEEGHEGNRHADAIAKTFRKHVSMAVVSTVTVAVAFVCMIVFSLKLVTWGQTTVYRLSGGQAGLVTQAPTVGTVLVGLVLALVAALAVKSAIESIWSLWSLHMGRRDGIACLAISIVSSVLMLLTFALIPCLGTSMWLGALVTLVAIIILYFVIPGGECVSIVPVFRAHARNARLLEDVANGEVGVEVDTVGERREAMRIVDGLTADHNKD